MFRRSNPWPSFVDLFSALMLAGFGAMILLSGMLAELRTQVDTLKGELAEERNKNQDLRKRLAFWRQKYGRDIPQTTEEVNAFCREAGRGHPKCQEDNVLVEVTLVRGQIEMKVVGESAALAQFLAGSGVSTLKVGSVMTDPRAIETFLDRVSRFYEVRRAANKECRFDYRLTYGTNDDYHDARVRFENYFYPARINEPRIGSK